LKCFCSAFLTSENKPPQNETGRAVTTWKPVPFMVFMDLRSNPTIGVTKQGCEWIDDTTVRVFGQVSIAPLPGSLLLASRVFMWVLTALTVLVACGVVCSCSGIRTYVGSCNFGRVPAPSPDTATSGGSSAAAATSGGSSAKQDDLAMIMKHLAARCCLHYPPCVVCGQQPHPAAHCLTRLPFTRS
jgi:hypothetical protein